MSPKFVGACDCGRELVKNPFLGEEENNYGISVRCGACGGTVFLRPEGSGREIATCPWFIPLSRQDQREVEA